MDLRAEPGHITGWSLGARFYPVLYMLTRMGKARDWGKGLPLKANFLGKMSSLEVQGLLRGQVADDHADPETGVQMAVFDLAWPDGLQPGLTGPTAVLLDEPADVLSLAGGAGFRCFATAADFRNYVETEMLRLEAA